jgi:hypothetical protein
VLDITKDELQARLAHYHTSQESNPSRRPNSPASQFVHALDNFINDLPASPANTLRPEQTYELATLLLAHQAYKNISKRADHLARQLEKKFNAEEFKQLKTAYDSNTLDLNTFLTICKPAQPTHATRFFQAPEAASPMLQTLLNHAMLGELVQARELWREHPDLLKQAGTVFQPSDISPHHNPGRYHHQQLTYLQILWANGEYEEARQLEEHLGPEETAKQFFALFPDGIIQKNNFDLAHANTLLNNVFEALLQDKTITASNLDEMNDTTRDALYALHDYAKPDAAHQTGLVFDFNFYLAARTLLNTQGNRIGSNHNKSDFWRIRVEEWLKACLGTGYLRQLVRGINSNAPDPSGCLLSDYSSYFAFQRSPDAIPGLHFYVGDHGAIWNPGDGVSQRKPNAKSEQDLQTFHQAKTSAANDLRERMMQTKNLAHRL